MNLAIQVQHGQVQSLAITAQVIQSIKLLQYSQEELQIFLSEQIEKNPLIDIASDSSEPSMADPTRTASHARDSATEQNAVPGLDERRSNDHHLLSSKHLLERPSGRSSGSGAVSSDHESHNLEDYCASSVSLLEHLRSQMTLALRDKVQLMIAAEIVGSVDDDGYLRRDLSEVADKLSVTMAEVEAIVRVIQSFSPTGVGARNLAECLRIQLRESGRLNPAMNAILENLSLLAAYDFPKLEKLCGVDKNKILEMAREIRKLNPRPGGQFDSEPMLPVQPDVLVVTRRDGTFAIELNPDCLPRILVDRDYYSEVSANCVGQDEKKFVTDCLNSANWLTKNLDRRARTILRVATEIVARQREFLLHGVAHLKPLTLNDVAEAIGMHESTVSRATSNKFMMTNRGMFELKFFFTTSVASFDGSEGFSAESIHHMIKKLVDVETADTTFSDDALVAALRSKGVNIARRTVAKYRNELHIPSSQLRRRRKRA